MDPRWPVKLVQITLPEPFRMPSGYVITDMDPGVKRKSEVDSGESSSVEQIIAACTAAWATITVHLDPSMAACCLMSSQASVTLSDRTFKDSASLGGACPLSEAAGFPCHSPRYTFSSLCSSCTSTSLCFWFLASWYPVCTVLLVGEQKTRSTSRSLRKELIFFTCSLPFLFRFSTSSVPVIVLLSVLSVAACLMSTNFCEVLSFLVFDQEGLTGDWFSLSTTILGAAFLLGLGKKSIAVSAPLDCTKRLK
mmetsp:Transcript_9150/g.27743  ORF Transcript_9150/g.27743 Transcript_9150/m.27743 type:complete len:251 (-) Transcript_9150:855-1607(-)